MTRQAIAKIGSYLVSAALIGFAFTLSTIGETVSLIVIVLIFCVAVLLLVLGVFLTMRGHSKPSEDHVTGSKATDVTSSFESLGARVAGNQNTTIVGNNNVIVAMPPTPSSKDSSMESDMSTPDDDNQLPEQMTVLSPADIRVAVDDVVPLDPKLRDQTTAVLYDRLRNAKLLVDAGRHAAAIETLGKLRFESAEVSLPADFHSTLANRLGVAYLGLGRLDDAEKELEASVRISPGHVKASINLASLRLRQGKAEEGLRLTDQVFAQLDDNPTIGAVRVQALHLLGRHSEVEEFVSQFPESTETPSVKSAIARIRLTSGESQEAVRFARELISVEPNEPLHELLLGEALIATFVADAGTGLPVPWLMPGSQGDRIEEAASVLTDAVGRMELREEPGPLRLALLGRAHARMILQEFERALDDCTNARRLGPDDDQLRLRMGSILLLTGQPLEARKLLSAIEDEELRRAVLPQEASALLGASRIQEAIALLEPVWRASSEDSLPVDIGELLIDAYIVSGESQAAFDVLRRLQSTREPDQRVLQIAARFASKTGRETEAEKLYEDSFREASPSEKDWIALQYADFLCANGKFSRSIELYAGRVPVDRSSPYLRNYLAALWNADELGKLFDATAKLRTSGVKEEIVEELHARCLLEAGDTAKASEIWRSLIDSSTTPSRFRLEAGVTAFREGDREQARQFARQVPIQDLEGEPFALMQLAQLRHSLGMDDVLTYAYAAWRQAPRDAKIHGSYIQILLSREDIESELTDSTLPQVIQDSTVFLRYDQQEVVFTIHDQMPPNITEEDIPVSDSTAAKLLGRHVGDEIDFGSGRSFEITEIRSKYSIAASRAMSGFEGRFPDNPAVQTITVDKDLSLLRDTVARQNEFINKVVEHYRGGAIPLATVAQSTGKSVIDVWGGLASLPGEEILVWQGDSQETLRAIAKAKEGVAVLDPTAILALATIGQLNGLKEILPRVIVPQAVLDEFMQHFMSTYQGKRPEGRLSSQGEDLSFAQLSEEDWETGKKFFEDIVDFIIDETERVAAPSYLSLEPEQRGQLTDAVGKSSLIPILVAQEIGAPLYTDDHVLRALAKSEYSVCGIWTGAVMAAGRDEGNLPASEYSDVTCSLISLNYVNVPITSRELVWAFKNAEQQPNDSFRRVTGQLGGSRCDAESAIAVGGAATKLSWTEITLFDRRMVFVDEILRALQTDRSDKDILDRYRSYLRVITSSPALPEWYWEEVDRLIRRRS